MEDGRPAKAPRKDNATAAQAKDDVALKEGPFSVLYSAMNNPKAKVLISCRNETKITGTLLAYDRHFNMVLKGAMEAKENKESGDLDMRSFETLFLRGDNVIFVIKMD